MTYAFLQVATALGFLSLVASGGGQGPLAASALSCRIVADDGTAVPRAVVRVVGSDGPGVRIGVTDSTGTATFTGLPAGSFSVTATKTGYVTSIYGAKRSGNGPAVPIALASGQRLDVILTLVRGAAISGRISDPTGRPLPQVSVEAIRLGSFAAVGAQGDALTVTTDSHGSYRLFGLAPGDYVLMAMPTVAAEAATLVADNEVAWALRQLTQRTGTTQMSAVSDQPPSAGVSVRYGPKYFPNATTFDDAVRVTLGPGETRNDISLALELTRTSTISGRIVASGVQLPASTELALVPQSRGLVLQSRGINDPVIRRFQPSEDRFSVVGVVPGRYALYARSDPGVVGRAAVGTNQTLWGAVEVQVGGQDLPDVIVTLSPGPRLTGSVAFDAESRTGGLDRSNVKVALSGHEGLPPLAGSLIASVNSDGRFSFPSLPPWRYGLRILPERPVGSDLVPWILKSAVAGVDDLADKQVELRYGDSVEVAVVLTSRESEIAGVLEDAAGRPTAEFAIVVLSADRKHWTPGSRRVRATQPATDGTFRFAGLPAGEYDVVCVADLDRAGLSDPAYLEQLAAFGFRLSLADGERRALNLRAGR